MEISIHSDGKIAGFAAGAQGYVVSGEWGISGTLEKMREKLDQLRDAALIHRVTVLAPTAVKVIRFSQEWCIRNGIPFQKISRADVAGKWCGNCNATAVDIIDEAERRGFPDRGKHGAMALAALEFVIGLPENLEQAA